MHYVCTMFALCLCYVLMSFDVTGGKIQDLRLLPTELLPTGLLEYCVVGGAGENRNIFRLQGVGRFDRISGNVIQSRTANRAGRGRQMIRPGGRFFLQILNMDTKETLLALTESLGLQPGVDTFGVEGIGEEFIAKKPREKYLLEWGNQKIGADAVFVQRITGGGSSFPLVYFRRLEDADPKKIANAHKLAWNMGQAPLLFIVLPGKIRVYSTYERPKWKRDGELDNEAGLIDILNLIERTVSQQQRVEKYKRMPLESGLFWEQNRERFHPKNRVDKMLLENLELIREGLFKQGLKDVPTIHRLLMRSIFIQYLESRKDSNGYCVFPEGFFEKYTTGATTFLDVLQDPTETYNLFEDLAVKFHGDMFPSDLAQEKKNVEPSHLELLTRFLRGDEELRQKTFWPFYSFDAIPIELISNIYEKFYHCEVKEGEIKKTNGTYYTPHRLVEFTMDEVLPWEGKKTDITILDPACGSGIFLVEAYRRLISRWGQNNPQEKLNTCKLKEILEKYIHGVDNNPEAPSVAAFSLYLTMCDYMEPRHIWSKVKFPELIGKTLFRTDFFDFIESPKTRVKKFDLVIGNPPWESKLSEAAKRYVKKYEKRKKLLDIISDKQIAQVFLLGAPNVCDKKGGICLIAPSKSLLFNISEKSRNFQKHFFTSWKVKSVINLSALSDNLFDKAKEPAAPVIYQPIEPKDSHRILYCCPKPSHSIEDDWYYIIEPQDISFIPVAEVVENEYIWKAAMWGRPRDWELIKKLSKYDKLKDICDRLGWVHGEGFIEGGDGSQKDEADWLTNRPYVSPENLERFIVDEKDLPKLKTKLFHRPRSRKKRIYEGPHLLIGQSYHVGEKSLVSSVLKEYAVFPQSIIGIAADRADINKLGVLCIIINSKIVFYYEMLTSGRWLVERNEMAKTEIMDLPIPDEIANGSKAITYEQLKEIKSNFDNKKDQKILNKKIAELYALTENDLCLIDDAIEYTLDYFWRKENSAAVKKVSEGMLNSYMDIYCSILNEAFGRREEKFTAQIYKGACPLIAMRVSLDSRKEDRGVKEAPYKLQESLNKVDSILLEKRGGSVYIRRDIRVYDGKDIYIVKRNQQRFWTKSVAMSDADETYGDIMRTWRG